MIFELTANALNKAGDEMGASILKTRYLDNFMKSVIGYITIDLQHNTEANL